jgi:hypothetical protein
MHESDPDDQLRSGDDANSACRRCHEDVARRSSEHSHHATSSSGNSCVACHMPYTSYALFRGLRSHRIDSPSVRSIVDDARPNACNLCHLDRTLGWTRAQLAEWYEQNAARAVPDEAANVTENAYAVERLLAGDAAERAIFAWAFGLDETRSASGASFQPPYLAALLDDPYSAVRFIAARSLRTFPGFSTLDYDFLAPPERRRAVRDSILSRAPSDAPRIEALLARQDRRPVSISE